MRWSCPHCNVSLAVADEKLGAGWSFSQCYKCSGYALVRKAGVNLIKIDRAPNGQPIAVPQQEEFGQALAANPFAMSAPQPPAGAAPATMYAGDPQRALPARPATLMNQTATQRLAQISAARTTRGVTTPVQASPSRAELQALRQQEQARLEATQRAAAEANAAALQASAQELARVRAEIESERRAQRAARASIEAAAREQRLYEPAVTAAPTLAAAPEHALPAPLPELPPESGILGSLLRAGMLPFALGIASVVAIGSGAWFYVQGQALLRKAQGMMSTELAPPTDPARAPKKGVRTAAAKAPVSDSVMDSVRRSAMAPERAPDAEEAHANPSGDERPSAPTGAPLTIRLKRSAMFYTGPGTGYSMVGSARAESRFTVVDWNEQWFKVTITDPDFNVGQAPARRPAPTVAWVKNDAVQLLTAESRQ